MAYEYKSKLLDYASDSKTYEEYKAISQELQEVYRKAKEFDEIKKLEKETRLYSIAGKEDVELGTEARKIINKYTEDKQND